MRPPEGVRRYALARSGAAQARRAEGVKRLRLVRMEEIAELDREPSPAGRDQLGSSAPRRS